MPRNRVPKEARAVNVGLSAISGNWAGINDAPCSGSLLARATGLELLLLLLLLQVMSKLPGFKRYYDKHNWDFDSPTIHGKSQTRAALDDTC